MKNYTINHLNISTDMDNIEITISAKQGKKTIGYIKGKVNSMRDCIECDTAVVPEERGKGIASELLKRMIDSVFKDKMLDSMCEMYAKGSEAHNILLNIDVENYASRRVAEKMGFTLVDDSGRDSVEYAITRAQYLKGNAQTSVQVKDEGLARE